jgi:hypothetical protein
MQAAGGKGFVKRFREKRQHRDSVEATAPPAMKQKQITVSANSDRRLNDDG